MSILTAPGDIASAIIDPIAASIKNPFNRGVQRTGDLPVDFPGGFVMVEYIEGAPDYKNQVRLVGNMLPMIPFSWGGEQRLTKEYYPGNPEPSVHVLGSKENEVTIHGRFKDKRYRDSALYGVSYEIARACDEMRKRGNLVRFNLGDWVRYGWIEKCDFKMNKKSWVEYELSLFIVGERQPRNNYFIALEKTPPEALNNSLISLAVEFQAAYSSIPSTMPQSIADLLNGIINDVATNINVVTNFVGGVISTAQDIKRSADRAIGLIKNTRTFLSKTRRQLATLLHGFANLSAEASAAAQFSASFKNLVFINEITTSTLSMNANLAKMQAQFDKIAKTIPINRHKVVTGDTLQRLAVKYYGATDNWKLIYDHNKLQTTQLTGGQILEIPKP